MFTRFAWIVFGVLVVLSILVVSKGSAFGWTETITGAFAGALAGSAASMLASLLERHQAELDRNADAKEQRDIEEQRRLQAVAEEARAERERVARIKALITVDLVQVAVGHIQAAKSIAAAHAAAQARGAAGGGVPLSGVSPYTLPFLEMIGTDVLLLSSRELDVVGTLQANLGLTRKRVGDLISRGQATLLDAIELQKLLHHDMGILREAFEIIAPQRRLQLPGGEPEPAGDLLRRVMVETELW